MAVSILTEEEAAVAVASSLIKYHKRLRLNYDIRELQVCAYFSNLNRDVRRKYISMVSSLGSTILLGNGGFMLDPGQHGEASLKSAFKLPKAKALHFASTAARHKTIIKPTIIVDAAGACMLGNVFSRYETLKNIEQVSS